MGKVFEFDPQRRGKQHRRTVPARSKPHYRRRVRQQQGSSIGRVAILAAIVLFAVTQYVSPIPGCDIKGNISYRSGEHIYHVPGQEYYSETRVDFLKGERWFCSEEAARAAGWRKAYR
ncbi:hypothetical protein [Sinorhizobium fredii]|uniref:sunset domain-containing protein n=1 Tax=Rhizobium fredii TaxID=380 RepID=UPI001FCB0639|nr:hypothetical protein [Sinorhizobium fredii]